MSPDNERIDQFVNSILMLSAQIERLLYETEDLAVLARHGISRSYLEGFNTLLHVFLKKTLN
jgi:hypothetical protein